MELFLANAFGVYKVSWSSENLSLNTFSRLLDYGLSIFNSLSLNMGDGTSLDWMVSSLLLLQGVYCWGLKSGRIYNFGNLMFLSKCFRFY